MIKSITKIVLFLVLFVLLFSCNVTKHVADGEYLLKKNTVFVNDKKETSPDVLGYLQQRPNEKILGVPVALHIYNWGNPDTTAINWPYNKPKFARWLGKSFSKKQVIALNRNAKWFNNWKLKSGNPPVISNQKKVEKSVKALKNYYFNKGYWDANATYEEQKGNDKKTEITYKVNTHKPHFLDTVSTKIKSPILDSIYQIYQKKSFITQGKQYNYTDFEDEQNRLSEIFRNSGIYAFSSNAIKFDIELDSAATNPYKHNVLLKIPNRKFSISDSIFELPYEIQRVKNVNVYTDYTFETKDLAFKDTATYNGINFFAVEKLKYNPKYLSNAIVIQPDSIYKDSEKKLTRKYLRDLENFQASLDIKYEENLDGSLTASIYLNPLKKFGLSVDADFTTSNINPFGISGKLGVLNRNVFKGAEVFELSFQGSFLNTAVDVSEKEYFLNLNALEIGSTASLKIPRIFFPINTKKIIPKRMTPKTNINLSVGFQENIGLDRRNITGSLGYTWQSKKTTNHKLELLNVQYINNRNIGRYFKVYGSELTKLNQIAFNNPVNNQYGVISPGSIDENNNGKIDISEATPYINYVLGNSQIQTLKPKEYAFVNNINKQKEILVEDVLVPVMSYQYSYNNRKNFKDNNFSTFTGRLISSGSIITSLVKKTNDKGEKVLFGLPIKQYIKTELEYKKYWSINQNSTVVMRNFVGAAIPFGNSDNIPFSRSYRAGGSNDIRGWRTFDLGLGSNYSTLEFNVGSFKFTSNLEYRFKMFNSLNGAIFIDAGNIWDISKTSITSQKEKLKGFNSVKEIAVASGLGGRYDFGFLIFRVDLGFKTYEPYLESNSKWFKNYNLKNAVLNIGINYPF